MTDTFRIELHEYFGPMDLLLYLVRKSELDVCDLSLTKLTAQFVEYVDTLKLIDLDLAGEFVQTAGTLLEIKSREALPREIEEEAQEEVTDPSGTELVERLLEYRRFKQAALTLEEQARSWRERYPRLTSERPTSGKDAAADRFKEVELWDLVSALSRVLRTSEAPLANAVLQREEKPVAELVVEIGAKAKSEGKVRFSECFDGRNDRGRVVGVFLAILELVRHHGYKANQQDDGGDFLLFPPDDTHEAVA
ncbi:segregation and condensation protein A [Calycomorphotria hydatis]|uniref:Segregation and condensation protein A n=1 Tax=Calycomorphotria hydatis TaxID=2528027 RepID=A0A517TAA3_9PLAN|nr:segregation/condensation protein A [Calycomorphotria hydatis]QDT65296.1 Segregation and condensation protein A [Calycomorphotria hydatis]